MQGVEVVAEHDLSTPFGRPSDPVVEAQVAGRSVFFLPRHGKGHRYTPSEVPYQANVHVMKQLGVTHLLAVSAVGIMQEQIKPGDMVIPDQIFDRTKDTRPSTFFGEGIVGHVSFADPFCDDLRGVQGGEALDGVPGRAARCCRVARGAEAVQADVPQVFARRSGSPASDPRPKPAAAAA